MMKTTIAILFFGLLTVRAFAVEPASAALTVAVMDFADDSGGKRFGGNVTALITAELASDTNLVMMDRGTLEKALKEQALGVSGLINSDTASKIGQVTGVKVLVSGQVITLGDNRLVIVADIVGTETARLLAVKVDGPEDKLEEMISDLGAKIARATVAQAADLVGGGKESNAARLGRIVKSVTGTNRPTVQVGFYHPAGPDQPSYTANTEMGRILQRAGFTVVDGNSEAKPEIEITGMVDVDGSTHGELHTEHAVVEVKVRARRTGQILCMDRQESMAVDATQVGAQRSAQALAVDELAERILPSLAK
jgi:hypothetical protein